MLSLQSSFSIGVADRDAKLEKSQLRHFHLC